MKNENEVVFSKWLKERLLALPGWTAQTIHEREPLLSRAACYCYVSGTRVPNEVALKRIVKVLCEEDVARCLAAADLAVNPEALPTFAPKNQS